MRACQRARDGYAERDGVKPYDEVFGAGEPTVLLLPTWSIIHLQDSGQPSNAYWRVGGANPIRVLRPRCKDRTRRLGWLACWMASMASGSKRDRP